MTVHFQCTYEDFREANLGHAAGTTGRKKATSLRVGAVGWLMFFVLLVLFMLLRMRGTSGTPGNEEVTPPAAAPQGWALVLRFAIASAPTVFVCALLVWLVVRGAMRPPPKPWEPPPTGKSGVGTTAEGTVLGVVFGVSFASFLYADRLPIQPAPWPRGYEYLLPLLPVGLLVGLTILLAALERGPGLRQRWAAQPFLHRAHTMEATDEGMTLVEEQSRHDYRWDYFPGFRETDNILLLYVSPYGFWIIPKRAFNGQEHLDTFKGLLMTHVRHGVLLPQPVAFPVVPLAIAVPDRRAVDG